MKKLQTGLLMILFALLLFISTNEAEAASVDDIRFYVEMYYYGEQPENLNSMTTIKEITDALDKYSRYMTPDEYEMYKTGSSLAAPAPPLTAQSSFGEETVTSALLYGDIGYIKITHFTIGVNKEVTEHWIRLRQQGAQELIIDLRYNGGGYVDSAEQLLGLFREAPIAYVLSTRERESIVETKSANIKFPHQPYILVNRYSASASEMVAVSLQDQKAATIVGEQTTGKATTQSLYEFDDGSALKLTTGMFTGPNGTIVQDSGVTPDIQTRLDEELVTLHHELLEQKLSQQGYIKFSETEYTTEDKTIHVGLPYKMNFTGAYPSNKIQLVELGHNTILTTIEQQKENLLLNITPSKARLSKNGYFVIIEPTMKRLNGKRINTKMYTTATVK